LLAGALAGSSAFAVPGPILGDASDLQGGTYQAKYLNFSDLYYAQGTSSAITGASSNAGVNGAPVLYGAPTTALGNAVIAYLTGGANAPGTLENRAAFNAGEIDYTNGPYSGSKAWNGATQQLSGLFYNLTLSGAVVGTLGSDTTVTLDYVPSTRSTPLAGLPGVSSLPVGSGGVIQIYASSTLNFSPDANGAGSLSPSGQTASGVNGSSQVQNGNAPAATAGSWAPANWVAGTGSTSDSVTGTGSTSGSLWLAGEFVPFSAVGKTAADGDPNTVYQEEIDVTTGASIGEASGYVDLVGGSEYPFIEKGAEATSGINVDMTLLADEATPGVDTLGNLSAASGYSGIGYWVADSEDPVAFAIVSVPEPATLSLLGFGIAGLLARCRKK
jgi:hypothetical protein